MISTRMIFQRLCRKLGWRALLTVLSASARPSMWIGRGTTEQSHNLGQGKVDAALETLNLNGKLDALMASHLPFCIS